MSFNVEGEIRGLVHEILGEGYASERVVDLTKKLLAMAWDEGYDKAWGMETDVQDENPYKETI